MRKGIAAAGSAVLFALAPGLMAGLIPDRLEREGHMGACDE
jgi:hypothetical protein